MASPLSVGEIIDFTSKIIEICMDMKDAPKEIKKATTDMELMQVAHKHLRKQLEEKGSIIIGPDIIKVIKRDLKSLRSNIKEVQRIAAAISEDGIVTFLGRLRYATIEKTKMLDVLSNFADHRSKLDHILQILQTKSHSQIQSNQAQSNQALHDLETKLESIRAKQASRATEHAKRQGKDASIDKVLQDIKSRLPQVNTTTANAMSGQLWNDVKRELVKSGADPASVEAAFSHATKASSQLASLQVPANLQSKPASIGHHSISTNVPGKSKSKAASPSPTRPTSAGANSKPSASPSQTTKTPKSTEGHLILCVDWENNARSSWTQTYLEIIRLLTVSTTGRWLFEHVQSAGIDETATDAKLTAFDVGTGIDAATIDAQFPWSVGYPNEVSSVMQRIGHYPRRRLQSHDMAKYDTIITFSNGMETQLRKAQEHFAKTDPGVRRAKIRQLAGCYEVPDLDDPVKIRNLVDNITTGINAFIAEDLRNWSMSNCFESNEPIRRTVQTTLSAESMTKLEWMVSNTKVLEQTECQMRSTKYQGEALNNTNLQYLVSITGAKKAGATAGDLVGRLKRVEEMIAQV